ncbi:MAG TPA: ParA family protein [Limnobacter sp.]|nr:ParA family protein [Limnobacter sp.]
MRRVVFNQKGGVGKSTITSNLAAISASQGLKTLLIDLDPQGNSTQYIRGRQAEPAEYSLADFYDQALNFKIRPKKSAEFITETPYENLDLLASHPALEELQVKLESRYKIFKLREALDELQGQYDRVYIDTPPALNFFSRSALIAANSVLIPFDCDEFSRRALYNLLDALNEIRADHNPALNVEGIVVNQFQPRASLPQKLVAELREEGHPVLNTCLSSSVKIRESHDAAQPMIHFMPSHKLTQEFLAMHAEIEQAVTAQGKAGKKVA